MNNNKKVTVEKIREAMGLTNLTEKLDLTKIEVDIPDVNRPALQLAGYYEYFEPKRVEIVGIVEYEYMKQMGMDKRVEMYRKFFSYDIPCVIYCRDLRPSE